MIEMQTVGVIPHFVYPDDRFAVEIDVSAWLETDTIQSVAYLADDPDVLDQAKSTHVNAVLKPYIKGKDGVATHIIKCLVVTADGDQKTFFVRFQCQPQNP